MSISSEATLASEDENVTSILSCHANYKLSKISSLGDMLSVASRDFVERFDTLGICTMFPPIPLKPLLLP
jgi:hypothetical protein